MKYNVLSFTAVAALSVFSGQAAAQQESLGERSLIFSCFYECKEGPPVQGVRTWREVTTLMLANQSTRSINSRIVFLNGNQRMIAIANNNFSPLDLDEINVCRTLEAGGIVPAPSAGLIEVELIDPLNVGGVYGWVKNLLGKFFVTEDEPFAGRVEGIGKTQCRVAPPSVITPAELDAMIATQNPPTVLPILIEGTQD